LAYVVHMANKDNPVNGDQQRKALRPKEAAARWAVSKSSLYKLLKDGSIRSFTIGLPGCRSSRLILIEDLDGYFRSRLQQGGGFHE
jgi:excisionase family DNA binding protein